MIHIYSIWVVSSSTFQYSQSYIVGYTVDPNSGGTDRNGNIYGPDGPGGSPAAFPITQSSGSQSPNTGLSYFVADPNLNDYYSIQAVYVLFNSSLQGAGGCYVMFRPWWEGYAVYLMSDDGSQWLGGDAPGTTTTYSNSQCTLDVSQTALYEGRDGTPYNGGGAGNYIVASPALTFTSSFLAAQPTEFLGFEDDSAGGVIWQTLGALGGSGGGGGGATVTLTPPSSTIPSGAGSGNFSVTVSPSSGSYTATSNNPDWLTVTCGASGAGSGTVCWTAAANLDNQQRSGSIKVNDNQVIIVQLAGGVSQVPGNVSPPIFTDNRPYPYTYYCNGFSCNDLTGSCTTSDPHVSASASNRTSTTTDITFRANNATLGYYALSCKTNGGAAPAFYGPTVIWVIARDASFGGGFVVSKDQSVRGSAPAMTTGVWRGYGDTDNVVAFVSGSTISAGVTFVPTPVPQIPIDAAWQQAHGGGPGVRIEGVISGGGKFVSSGYFSIPAASSFGATLSYTLPASTAQRFDKMIVQWQISSDGSECASNCALAGGTHATVFVTLGHPRLPVYYTALDLAVPKSGTVTTQADAFQQTWARFSGPANVTTWYGQKLYYYLTGDGFRACALNDTELLVNNPDYSGQCTSFADLFLRALAANGIPVGVTVSPPTPLGASALATLTTVGTNDGSAFLVRDWTFVGADTATYVGSPSLYWWAMPINPAIPLNADGNATDFMVPPQPGNVYGDVTSLNMIPGQNTAPPSEKVFGKHWIVKADNSLINPGIGGPYFDPSYGVTYSDNSYFELTAIDGYAVRDFNRPDDPFAFVALDIHYFGPQSNIYFNP